MKRLVAVTMIALATHAAPAVAQPGALVPLIGRWALEVARMPVPPAERPKSVTMTFGAASAGKWTMQVEIADGGGASMRANSTFALDGTPVPAMGTPEADTIAAKQPAPNVLVVSLGQDGDQASTRVYAVQPDGRTMIETATYYCAGAPVMRTNYFTRIAGR